MMYYGINYERINGRLKTYAYVCKFFSSKIEIDVNTYFDLMGKDCYQIVDKNTYLSGSYYFVNPHTLKKGE